MLEKSLDTLSLQELSGKIKGKIKQKYNLAHLTWMKVGGEADIFFSPADLDDLINFLVWNNTTYKLPITVIGAGSNIIVRDKGIEGIVIRLGPGFSSMSLQKEVIEVGAGCLNFNLANFCKHNSITGLEFLVGIPGTIGGGVFMNAGSYGSEFSDLIQAVECVDMSGNIHILDKQDLRFEYRKTHLPGNFIVIKAFLTAIEGAPDIIERKMHDITSRRSESQPVKEKTAGSTFVNPGNQKAWELIEQSGMKGFILGGAKMSEKHCNFMINHNNSSASDLEKLGETVIDAVANKFGIKLKWEVQILGRKN